MYNIIERMIKWIISNKKIVKRNQNHNVILSKSFIFGFIHKIRERWISRNYFKILPHFVKTFKTHFFIFVLLLLQPWDTFKLFKLFSFAVRYFRKYCIYTFSLLKVFSLKINARYLYYPEYDSFKSKKLGFQSCNYISGKL